MYVSSRYHCNVAPNITVQILVILQMPWKTKLMSLKCITGQILIDIEATQQCTFQCHVCRVIGWRCWA